MQPHANNSYVPLVNLPYQLISFPVMLNDLGLYEHILDDDIFFGVVGMLECE